MTLVSTEASHSSLLGVYSRVGPLFVAGEGCELVAEDGSRYLDFVAGIAVNALGYNHPVIRESVARALETGLLHVSNLYRSEPGERLAAELVTRAFAHGGQAFFCNSGAEANEGAFKFARKWSGKTDIVAFNGSFHGRLFASLAATDRPDYKKPFEPLLPGVRIVELSDRAAVRAVTDRTAAVIIEPVQGEGGVRPVPSDLLCFLRQLCNSRGAALIFDEVQCGLGRTGTLFAAEPSGVTPDMFTLAKPLAGGLPMGAILVSDRIAATLAPGDHATTFGGGPFVASVALDVVRAIAEPEFLATVRDNGAWFGERLHALAQRSLKVREIRGRGLIWGIELAPGELASTFVTAARERHLLVLSAGPNVIRLVPPLIISRDDLERGVAILEEVLA